MHTDTVVSALLLAIKKAPSKALYLSLAKRYMELGQKNYALTQLELCIAQFEIDEEVLSLAIELAKSNKAKQQSFQLALETLRQYKPNKKNIHRTKTGKPLTVVTNSNPVAKQSPTAKTNITFKDIAGMKHIKKAITRAFIQPYRQPELLAKFGKKITGGLLLYGPPGCGKTYIARAVAGEIGAAFHSVALSDVLDMWLGESEKKLHEIFENVRASSPSVLFFDEIDGLGQSRELLKGKAERNLVNQLLSEMNGFNDNNQGVFFLAATNHPWDVDTALIRPGRFDNLIFVPPPDKTARKHILQFELNHRLTENHIPLNKIVEITTHCSGADLSALVERATELAIEKSVQFNSEHPINQSLLIHAANYLKPSIYPWLATAKRHIICTKQNKQYDALYNYLKENDLL